MEETIRELFVEFKDEINFDMKEEQVEILAKLCSGENVLGILPTGYGKSLIYSLAPLMMDKVISIKKNSRYINFFCYIL